MIQVDRHSTESYDGHIDPGTIDIILDTNNMNGNNYDDDDNNDINDEDNLKTKIQVDDLLSSNPQYSGYCEKKSNSWWAYFFPFLFPLWKRRYLVIIGNYVYRFESHQSSKLKGIPIPLDAVLPRLNSEDSTIVELYSYRKTYSFKFESIGDAETWLKEFISRKYTSIKEIMGHKKFDHENIKYFNKLSQEMYDKKLYIESEIAKEYVKNPLNPTSEI